MHLCAHIINVRARAFSSDGFQNMRKARKNSKLVEVDFLPFSNRDLLKC